MSVIRGLQWVQGKKADKKDWERKESREGKKTKIIGVYYNLKKKEKFNSLKDLEIMFSV